MEFKSQICTTKEQSERLLALGLKKETADMCYQVKFFDPFPQHLVDCVPSLLTHPPINNERFIPTWSLHRLIEMCNKTQVGMTIGIYNNEVTVDGDLFEVYDNTYDNLISIIELLIKRGYFYEDYLNIY
ncbi:MAG: hypothetical protein J6U90_03910 [Methanobrevibacter sp.]|nr:hypothetical protein [Methanobrevibacter sp.]